MKELSSHIKEEVKMHVETQQEKQKTFVGSFIKHPGHTVWQINLRTQEISEAKFSEEYITIDGVTKRNIIRELNHWYCSALNKKSAFNKFNKMAKFVLESKSNIQ
jgi:hypothetical protein